MRQIVAIDVGTSAVHAALFRRSESGFVLQLSDEQALSARRMPDGNCTLSAAELGAALLRSLRVLKAGAGPGPIEAIVFATVMHSYASGQRRGRRCADFSLWPDQRALAFAGRFARQAEGRNFRKRSGCPPWSVIPALRRMHSGERTEGQQRFYSLKSWILERFGQIDGEDIGVAGASGFLDWRKRHWDNALAAQAGVSETALPPLFDCETTLAPGPTSLLKRIFPSAQVCVGGSDGAAAHLGATVGGSEWISATIGSSMAARLAVPRESDDLWPALFRYPLDRSRDLIGLAGNNGGLALAEILRADRYDLDRRIDLPASLSVAGFCSPFLLAERCFDSARLLPAGFYDSRGRRLAPRALSDAEATGLAIEAAVFLLHRLISEIPSDAPLAASGGFFAAYPGALQWLSDLCNREIFAADPRAITLYGALHWLASSPTPTNEESGRFKPGDAGNVQNIVSRYRRWRQMVLAESAAAD